MSDLLPPNATAAERALSEAIARTGEVPVLVRDVWNPDLCPPELLPWLAWAFTVDSWDTSWTDTQKRGAIKASIAVHKYKGTIGALKEALAGIGFDAQAQEWFNQIPAGDPYTFKLLINSEQAGFSQLQFLRLLGTVQATKNLRSWLDEVVPKVSSRAGPNVAAVALSGHEITVTNYVVPFIGINEFILVG
ncbi:phage tail protein I [Perlucidibaca piscinae]|uniref:phage tail protein I n=1 Tax=Perlucidibaca piscinae TaxID=392589 RepID=UPI0003B63FFE|nr:phage tail protein I [Perlucidibaca piscinae]